MAEILLRLLSNSLWCLLSESEWGHLIIMSCIQLFNVCGLVWCGFLFKTCFSGLTLVKHRVVNFSLPAREKSSHVCGGVKQTVSFLVNVHSHNAILQKLFHGNNLLTNDLISQSSLKVKSLYKFSNVYLFGQKNSQKSYHLISFCFCCVFQLDPQTVQSKNWHMDVIEMNGVRHKQLYF